MHPHSNRPIAESLSVALQTLRALLDDIPIMTIAYDNTLLPKEPAHWKIRDLLLGSTMLEIFSIAQTMGLLLIGMEWLKNSQWQAWTPLNKEQIQTLVFLQIVAGGHLLLFVVRSRVAFFAKPLTVYHHCRHPGPNSADVGLRLADSCYSLKKYRAGLALYDPVDVHSRLGKEKALSPSAGHLRKPLSKR